MIESKGVILYQPFYIHPTAKVCKGTKIWDFCEIGKEVVIGKNCNIRYQVMLSNGAIIRDNVFIGTNVTILNDRYMNGKINPAKIAEGASIRGGKVILPRINVGKNALIGAGSIVTKDVKSGKVVYGNPAEERKISVDNLKRNSKKTCEEG